MQEKKITNYEYTSTTQESSSSWLVRLIQNNAITLFIQAVSLLTVLVCLYISSRLAPLAENISVVTERVVALESDNKQFIPKDEVNGKFAILFENDKRIENKIDRLLEK